MSELATFAAGCFWGVEDAFMQQPGVLSTTVGYTGGHTQNPTYKEVCTDTTGHAEAVLVAFDPTKITYETLLDLFWRLHDPTTLNRQGPDIGSQYRSAIYYHSPQQQAAARAAKEALEQSGRFPRPVVTEITAASQFYPAEEYHQKYNQKHGRHCHLSL
ncbi:peptide-methionine (S)-S-oxide reductase MsrA [Vampirovibrio chlorellavorus]|uniref:peptide-methionine (S)-S-oxide reductase MsrA n=1 Tax=Vampirovibrio chlorellavorus TaxID=758823 RepID=UPI0026EEA7F9|nr:peptide-methionine (S)-S-oxide reductase MsrA [Vampirovibrio chlorellavorus]